MSNKRISELEHISELDGSEEFAVVQDNTTKKSAINDVTNYIVGTNVEVSPDTTIDLNDSQYDNIKIVKLTWNGVAGNMTLNLPTASTHKNRAIRFVSNGGFETNTRVYLTPQGGDTLDGSTNYYEINKAYEGIYVWSSGNEWFIIQKKA